MACFLECLNVDDTKTVAGILEVCKIKTPFDLPCFLAMEYIDWVKEGLIQIELGHSMHMKQYESLLEMQKGFYTALYERNGWHSDS